MHGDIFQSPAHHLIPPGFGEVYLVGVGLFEPLFDVLLDENGQLREGLVAFDHVAASGSQLQAVGLEVDFADARGKLETYGMREGAGRVACRALGPRPWSGWPRRSGCSGGGKRDED